MKPMPTVAPELQTLIEAMCDGAADDEQVRVLESILLTNAEARQFYVYLLDLDAKLQRLIGSSQEGFAAVEEFIAARQASAREFIAPASPALPSAVLEGSLGFFSSGWPVAYLVATVVFAAALLIGAYTYVSHPSPTAGGLPSVAGERSRPAIDPVGRITGMVDCRWAEPNDAPAQGSYIPLGQKYTLVSGLMEITYASGARVILEGPTTYEVDSRNGGFLRVGKLTGKLAKRGEGRGERGEKVAGAPSSPGRGSLSTLHAPLSTASNPQSLIPNPSLSPVPCPLFSIQTPTATVTDLGTEFGIEVLPDRRQRVLVFQGQVEVKTQDDRKAAGETHTLLAGQSLQIQGRAVTAFSTSTPAADANRFVRTLRRTERLPAEVTTDSNLVLWLKADAIRGVKDGEGFGFWNDASGNRNNFHRIGSEVPTYVAGERSGVNGKPVVRFRDRAAFCGTLDADAYTAGVQPLRTPFTLFAAVKCSDDQETAYSAFFSGGSAGLSFGLTQSDGPPANSFLAWTEGVTYGRPGSRDSGWHVHAFVVPDLDPHHWTWLCDGRATGGAALDSGRPTPFEETVLLGAVYPNAGYWQGELAELLIYDCQLGSADLQKINAYLAKKYRIERAPAAREP